MKSKIKISPDGSNYPKEKILELIDTFGFFVDYDLWSEKGWIRIGHPKCKELGSLIIHKDHLEVNVRQEKIFLENTFQDFLIDIGEMRLKQKINELIKI